MHANAYAPDNGVAEIVIVVVECEWHTKRLIDNPFDTQIEIDIGVVEQNGERLEAAPLPPPCPKEVTPGASLGQ